MYAGLSASVTTNQHFHFTFTGRVTFKWKSLATIYAIFFYIGMTVVVFYVGRERIRILGETTKFDEKIYAYIFVIFLVCYSNDMAELCNKFWIYSFKFKDPALLDTVRGLGWVNQAKFDAFQTKPNFKLKRTRIEFDHTHSDRSRFFFCVSALVFLEHINRVFCFFFLCAVFLLAHC